MMFRATANAVGATIEITFHFPNPLPDNVECWKWDLVNGRYDHSAHIVSISAERMSITMEYQDGGFGDSDLLANRVVIDPAAFGAAPAPAGGDGGECFITSAGDTLPVVGKVATLMLLLGSSIIGLVGFSKK
jgi:hypothetical protein